MTPQKISLMQQLLVAYQKLLAVFQQQQAPVPVSSVRLPVGDPILYTKAVLCLDKHVTLDPSVPNEVGCAEAVSYVLSIAGIIVGPKGIAGTAALDAWLSKDKRFTRVAAPVAGAIIMSPTGQGNGSVEGHTGIVAKFGKQYAGDYGILSNNSLNGLFQEQWSLTRWLANYHIKGGLPVNYYVLNENSVA